MKRILSFWQASSQSMFLKNCKMLGFWQSSIFEYQKKPDRCIVRCDKQQIYDILLFLLFFDFKHAFVIE